MPETSSALAEQFDEMPQQQEAATLGIWTFLATEILFFGAMFLGYLAYPASKRSPRDTMPWYDWVLALVAGFCGAYLFLFYEELATRPGIPKGIATRL